MKRFLVILAIVAGFFVGNTYAETVKERLSKVREGAKKTATAAKEAGSRIREGTKKASEAAKDTGQRIKERTDQAREDWKERERKCSVCGQVIHVGTKCASCAAKEGADRTAATYKRTKGTYEKLKPEVQEAYTEAVQRAEKIRETSEKIVGAMNAAEEKKQEVLEVVDAYNKLRTEWKTMESDELYENLTTIANIPVPDRNGNFITLGQLASNKLAEKCPALTGTGLLDDLPATTTAVLCKDKDFFLNDVKIVKGKSGNNLSIVDAVKEASPIKPDTIMNSLDAMSALESLSSEDGSQEDLDQFLSAVGKLRGE